jgi:hypothetical protein
MAFGRDEAQNAEQQFESDAADAPTLMSPLLLKLAVAAQQRSEAIQ